MTPSRQCTQCGAELPPDAPQGLCVACLLRLGCASENTSGTFSQELMPAGTATKTVHIDGMPGVSEVAGDFDRYKILQRLGEGGCGIVYMAEQLEPVRRRVAIKVIKLGMDTRELIARFEAERQALAMMDHPNIAKVYDAGATRSGRPFFVMELVRGRKVTEFSDQQRLSTRARLKLFIQVCQAVQHAHQKGIIHRDLKPSNVLVTLHDGVPVPKVIDFGIAKATGQQQLTDKTLFTAFEQFIGTPAYMSPEQAELSGLDIDTRSDIYSLGVLLYELLTGHTPFDAQDLMRGGIEAICRTIREVEPPRPSTRLSTLAASDLATTAQRHDLEASKLVSIVRGDLDWIVMKALEKDRRRRYETANGLAMDLQRHLDNEAVMARPPSRAYRFQKAVQRHKLALAAAGAVVAAMAIGLIVTFWALAGERKARHVADAANKRASLEAERSEQSLEQMVMQKAEEQVDAGDDGEAMANLASLLRRNPSNRIVAERLLSALTFRRFAVPSFPPLVHDGMVLSAQFAADGRSIITTQPRRSAQVWDAGTGQLLSNVTADASVYALQALGWEHRFRAASRADRQVEITDLTTGRLVQRLPPLAATMSWGVFDASGSRLATFLEDGTTYVWDATNGARVAGPWPCVAPEDAAAFSPDQQWLAMASGTNVQVWEVVKGRLAGYPLSHKSAVVFVAFTPDSRRLVTACIDETKLGQLLQVWDIKKARPITAPMKHPGRMVSMDFSPDGKRLVTTMADHGEAHLWDATTGASIFALSGHEDTVISARFSPDGRHIATASFDQTVRVWDADTGRHAMASLYHEGGIGDVLFSPDSRRLLTMPRAGRTGRQMVRIWDVEPGEMPCETIGAGRGRVHQAALHPQGRFLFTVGSDRESVFWEMNNGRKPQPLLAMKDLCEWAEFSRDGRQLLLVHSGAVEVLDAYTRTPASNPMRHPEAKIARFSADGRQVATAGRDGTVLIWETQTGHKIASLSDLETEIEVVEFNTTGEWLLVVGGRKAVVYEAETGRLLIQLPEEGVTVAHFSPNASRVVTASEMGRAMVWDGRGGWKALLPLRHRSDVLDAVFSSDGRFVVTASWDRTARVWDAETGEPISQPMKHKAPVEGVCFSPDNRRVATASQDGTAHVWDSRTGLALSETFVHGSSDANWVRFSPDGRYLITASGEGGSPILAAV